MIRVRLRRPIGIEKRATWVWGQGNMGWSGEGYGTTGDAVGVMGKRAGKEVGHCWGCYGVWTYVIFSPCEAGMTEETTDTLDGSWMRWLRDYINFSLIYLNSVLGNLMAEDDALFDHEMTFLPSVVVTIAVEESGLDEPKLGNLGLDNISDDLYLSRVYSENAAEVWKELKETYDKLDVSILFNLTMKINNYKQNGLLVFEYYHKLNFLWREFDILTKLSPCTCDAKSELGKHNQLMKLMQFLMGLDNVYLPIRSSLLTQTELPDVKDAFVIVCREESHRGLGSGAGKNSSSGMPFTSDQIAKLMSLIGDKPDNGIHANMA
nr:ribonuclease H-like domain-containing protein [Tanacetum cinerariifolium]